MVIEWVLWTIRRDNKTGSQIKLDRLTFCFWGDNQMKTITLYKIRLEIEELSTSLVSVACRKLRELSKTSTNALVPGVAG